MTVTKVRIRFRKAGDLRLVSHHDLMRCFERAAPPRRGCRAPTQGFNPRPQIAFALSLALGVVGCEEVVELELTEPWSRRGSAPPASASAPPGIDSTRAAVRRIDRAQPAAATSIALMVPVDLPRGVPRGASADPRLQLLPRTTAVDRGRRRAAAIDVRPYLQ